MLAALQRAFPDADEFLIKRQLEWAKMIHQVWVDVGPERLQVDPNSCCSTKDEVFDWETEDEFALPEWWTQPPPQPAAL